MGPGCTRKSGITRFWTSCLMWESKHSSPKKKEFVLVERGGRGKRVSLSYIPLGIRNRPMPHGAHITSHHRFGICLHCLPCPPSFLFSSKLGGIHCVCVLKHLVIMVERKGRQFHVPRWSTP